MRASPLRSCVSVLGLAAFAAACGAPDDTTTAGSPGAAPSSAATAPLATEPVAFTGVDVVPMDRERVLRDHTVLVRDGRIAAIGPVGSVDVPAGARRVDGDGRYLMPGLAEMHAHVPGGGERALMERILFLYLSNGITTIRGMLGEPAHLELRERIRSGELLAPRFYTSGPSLNGRSIPDPDSARRAVLHQAEAGYDFIKIHPGLTRAAYDSMAAAAKRVGIPFAGHVPADVGLERALEAGQATIDHLDQYTEALVRDGADDRDPGLFGQRLTDVIDEAKIDEVAAATRRAGVWNVPTQSLLVRLSAPGDPEALARQPEMRYMPRSMVEGWTRWKRDRMDADDYSPEAARRYLEIRRALVGALHDAGAKLLLGSDAPQIFQVPGFSIRTELRELAAAGLSPYEALATGTRNVAEYFGAAEDYGTVAEGRAADLILLEANPLEDVDNAFRRAGVMVRGRWLPEAEIQRRLDEIAGT